MHILVCAHQPIASAYVHALDHIVGKHDVIARDLSWGQDLSAFASEIEALYEAHSKEPWLICVDLLGGSPMNCLVHILNKSNVLVLSGVNFPMLLSATAWQTLDEGRDWLKTQSPWGIYDVGEHLKRFMAANPDFKATHKGQINDDKDGI